MSTITEPKPYTLRVGINGQVELPKNLLAQYNLEEGDELNIIQLESVILLAPRPLVVPEMANQIAQVREQAGLSVDDLVAGLETVGQELYLEQYGQPGPI